MQSTSYSIPHYAPVVITTLLHHVYLPNSDTNDSESCVPPSSSKGNKHRKLHVVVGNLMCQLSALFLAMFMLPPHSASCLLRPLTNFSRRWPKVLGMQKRPESPLLNFLVEGGPFGSGCGKICELLSAYLLLSVHYEANSNTKLIFSYPPPEVFRWGPTPSIRVLCLVTALSVAPVIMIAALSKLKKSKESNVNKGSVDPSHRPKLTAGKHVWIICLAFGNALCEEMISRGFFYHELTSSGGLSQRTANLTQAASFGMAHYYILPLGWTGVLLASVYGWLMGKLMFYGGGLYLPVLAHTILDYFIFAAVAKKKVVAKTQ